MQAWCTTAVIFVIAVLDGAAGKEADAEAGSEAAVELPQVTPFLKLQRHLLRAAVSLIHEFRCECCVGLDAIKVRCLLFLSCHSTSFHHLS